MSQGRAARRDAASSVAPIASAIGTPCVLASHHASHPCDGRHYETSSADGRRYGFRRARRLEPEGRRLVPVDAGGFGIATGTFLDVRDDWDASVAKAIAGGWRC